MNANDAIRTMIAHSGKSGRQIARDMGRSPTFVSATLAQGNAPRMDTFSRIAQACGYRVVVMPTDNESGAHGSRDSLTVEYDGLV